MSIKICPNCGADVEGLTHHCDLCGEPLNPKKTLFHTMTYGTGAFYDIGLYLNRIFDRLDQIDPAPYAEVFSRIEFDFWCFPIEKKTGVAYYASRKQAIVTIEIDAEVYLYSTKEEKLALLKSEVAEKLELLRQRLEKNKIPAGSLFDQIAAALEQVTLPPQ